MYSVCAKISNVKRDDLDKKQSASHAEKLAPVVRVDGASDSYQPAFQSGASHNNNKVPHSIHPASRTSKKAGVGIITCLIIAVLMATIGFVIGTRMQWLSATQLDYSSLNEVYNVLSSKFDGKLDEDKLLEYAAKGMVAGAGDIYTEYMTAEEYADLEVELSGELKGIGVEIGLNADNRLSIISTLDDSPAKAAGLQAGDLIIEVDGEDATNWTTNQAASAIRGEIGTKVKLTVMRDGEQLDYEVERARVENPSVKWEVKDDIGYIRISTFGDDTAALSREAAEQLVDSGVKGIVLDLRSNTGGYVDAAQAVASLWLNAGDTVTQERAGNRTIATVSATGGNILKDYPTVVLIDGATASASEIVAGALRDNASAKLVGYQSFGKGLVQEVVELSNGDILKVTIAKWYTPNGDNINEEGLKPDEEVEMTSQQYNSGDDTQLDRAIEIINNWK